MITNEQSRLDAVRHFLDIGDSVSKDLDDVVKLAAEICETPISLITLLDKETQWFKSKIGLAIASTARDQSFCQFTIQQDGVMEVPDALLDERVNKLEIVTGEPNIRFYAGANLTTHEGHNLGTLCVLDTQPRHLTAIQQHTLTILAKQVVNIMELGRSVEILKEQHDQALEQHREAAQSQVELKAIFDSSNDIFILLGKHLEILSCNKAAGNYIFKVTGKELKNGNFISDVIDPAIFQKFIRFYSAALRGSRLKTEFRTRQGTPYASWLETSFVPVSTDGKVLGVAINASDITARKKHEQLIKVQNAALNRIATIQSHEIRKPVATLMGIMELINIEKQDGNQEHPYLDMITVTVNELNDKICGIVAESETTLNTKISDIESLD